VAQMSVTNINIPTAQSFILVDTRTGPNKVLFLPAASTIQGRYLSIKDYFGGATNSSMTISTTGLDRIDQRAIRYTLASSFGSVMLLSDGARSWNMMGLYEGADTAISLTVDSTPKYSALFNTANNTALSIPTNTAFTLGTNNHTIEFWFYQTTRNSYDTVFRYGDDTPQWTSTSNYYFNIGNSQFLVILGNGSGGWELLIDGGTKPTLNTWNHYALVRNGTTFTFYLNGTSRATATSSISIGTQSGSMVIGASSSTGGSDGFTGYISNFRFVNGTAVYTSNFTPPTTPLTAIPNTRVLIQGLVDRSANAFTVTNNGGVTLSTSVSPFIERFPLVQTSALIVKLDGASYSAGGGTWTDSVASANWTMSGTTYEAATQSVVFSSSLAYVSSVANFNSSAHTVVMYYYRTGNSPNPSGIATTGAVLYQIARSPSEVQTEIVVYEPTMWEYYSGFTLSFDANTSLSGTTGWVMRGFVKNGGTGTFYLNGLPDGTQTVGTASPTANRDFCIGRDYRDSNSFLQGKVALFAMWNVALSASEIASVHANCKGQFGL